MFTETLTCIYKCGQDKSLQVFTYFNYLFLFFLDESFGDMATVDISFCDPQLSFNHSIEMDQFMHILDEDNKKGMEENK